MLRRMISRRQLAAGAMLGLATPGLARAQAWPARPLRLVVPFAGGTTTDLFGRAIANHLTQALGQTVVVDNRSGAGGNIAAAAVARERPDGYTLILGTSGTHGVNMSLYREPGSDAVRDFTPVVPFVTAPVVLAVRPELGAADFAGLLELAKRRPLTFASAGNGTTGHLSQALLDLRAGVQTVHVPYRSGAQAVTDLLSGQVDAMFYHYLPLMQHVREGKLRVLGSTGARRTSNLPDVATMQELGLRDFVVEGWWAIYMPAGAPREIVDRINAATNEWLRKPEALETLRNQGVEPLGGTPEDLATRTAAEVAKWRDIIRDARIEPG
ncbi:Bug family tripartite tricarboxylate transporter substrate binding protein [Falsiroseomonas tokyonensis]|uniref:Bug family tripartite tricarboxylate transporter substrate binding protein n=1 Tax=Falsiroseomonas tokyonensis TaxID=430521 RepID=A0ABV7C4W6_9PROT|nr:tripartite tricarboxylate transporter substrate-binding protein [Falsiroseomonas tokyonensis]MBU8541197.1 tripartite tricarboxylate transporter substrate binding protein [Falsiroseomonas tokyonensis]